MERIAAQYLNPGDIIAPLSTDDPAILETTFTWEGAYGLTTELTYRYEGSTVPTTLRTTATRQVTVLERASLPDRFTV